MSQPTKSILEAEPEIVAAFAKQEREVRDQMNMICELMANADRTWQNVAEVKKIANVLDDLRQGFGHD